LWCVGLPTVFTNTTIDITLQCNLFEGNTKQAKYFTSGSWELTDLNIAPVVFSIYNQGSANGNNYKKVTLANHASVQYEWPEPLVLSGSPFIAYVPSIHVSGPAGVILPTANTNPINDICNGVVLKSLEGGNSKSSEQFLVEVFPNPTTGNFEIQIQGSDEEVQVEVYDLMGRLIEQKTGKTN